MYTVYCTDMVSKIIDSINSTCVTDQRLLLMQPIVHKDSSVSVKIGK